MSELAGMRQGGVLNPPISTSNSVGKATIARYTRLSSPSELLDQPKKPRVIHVLHLDGDGGGPVSINRMLGFFHHKHEQIMICGGRGRIYENCQRLQIPFYQLPLKTKMGALTAGVWQLSRLLKKLQPDLLVLHGQWGGPIGALAGKWAGVSRMIYMARWPSFYTSWDFFRVMRNHWAERVPCRLADWTVTLSESNFYQYYLRRHVPEGQLRMIPNSINMDCRPSPARVEEFRQRWGWTPNHCHVVSVGRLTDQKRVMWLVQGWPQVVKACPHAKLWIVGDGPRRSFLTQLVKKLRIEDSCTFLGEQDGITAISAADIVAATSVYEGMSNSVMEALVCGKPLVASDVDGIRDTVQRNVDGFLVRVGDVRGFALRLIELIQDPVLRAKMGRAGQKSIQRYDTPVVMAQYEELFNEALAVRKS